MQSPAIARLTFVCLFLLSAVPLLAQTPQPVPIRPPLRPGAHVREEPCWEEAGVSKAAIEQRRSLERSTKSQVEAVCADTALSAQQKHEKIHEIREHARQEMEAMVSPQQQEAIRSCQEARSAGRHPGGGMHHGGEGPCGEMPMAAPNPTKPQSPGSTPPSGSSPQP